MSLSQCIQNNSSLGLVFNCLQGSECMNTPRVVLALQETKSERLMHCLVLHQGQREVDWNIRAHLLDSIVVFYDKYSCLSEYVCVCEFLYSTFRASDTQ